MRKVQIDNKQIIESLKTKDRIVEELKALQKQAEEVEERGNTLMAEVSREEEKVKGEYTDLKESLELGEYEEVSRVYLDESKEKAYFDIADRLEEFKITFQNAKNNSGNTVQGDGDTGTDVAEPTEPTEPEDDSNKGQE